MLHLLSDENFNGDIVRGLRLQQPDLDIVRVQDVGLGGADDPDVLAWAAANNRFSSRTTARRCGISHTREWWREKRCRACSS